MSAEELAVSCGIGLRTLSRIESGNAGTALGTLLGVLWKLGLLDTLDAVANPDTDDHGKILEAARMPQRVRSRTLDNDF